MPSFYKLTHARRSKPQCHYALVFLLLCSAATAQTQLDIGNAASGSFGLVPNSLARVYLQATGPISIDPATTGVQIHSASGPTLTAPIVSVDAFSAFLILIPAGVPLGRADITVFIETSTIDPLTVDVLGSNVGIYTQGFGPAIAPPYRLTQPALPGQSVTIWTTGLGAAKQTGQPLTAIVKYSTIETIPVRIQ